MANADRAGTVAPDNGDVLPGTTVDELHVPGEPRARADELVVPREAVEDEREQYRQLFEFAPVGYVVTDASGMVCRANRAAVRMLNTGAQVLRGEPLALFVAPEERGAFHRALSRLLSTGAAQEWPMRLQPPQQRAVEVTMTVAAVRDGSGASRLYWIIRDDSERLEGDLL
jgi:PAS domain S-box-containing protein